MTDMDKGIKAGDVIVMRSIAQVQPTVRLTYVDLSAAIIASDDAEADFFLRGLEDASYQLKPILRTG